MGIDVYWKDERGAILGAVDDDGWQRHPWPPADYD